jgi:hypothetical protein
LDGEFRAYHKAAGLGTAAIVRCYRDTVITGCKIGQHTALIVFLHQQNVSLGIGPGELKRRGIILRQYDQFNGPIVGASIGNVDGKVILPGKPWKIYGKGKG